MNRIDRVFQRLRERREKGLIAFITACDPEPSLTERLVFAMERAGADLIELGVPFSDPMADGPVIQRASQRALRRGTTLREILELVKRLRMRTEIPLLLMSYYNSLLQYGLQDLAADAAAAGVDGLIVPDLPVEESPPLLAEAERRGLDLIPFAAPTSTPERLARTAEVARGFIYCVSLTGVTGMRRGLPPGIEEFIARVRRHCFQPLAIGFGISSPEQAARMAELGDAVIVGSAIVALIEEHQGEPDLLEEKVSTLVREIKEAITEKAVLYKESHQRPDNGGDSCETL
ncbi:MAG: tryptophan synthase subunit alpha [Thermacetogeniaceae bacterium]